MTVQIAVLPVYTQEELKPFAEAVVCPEGKEDCPHPLHMVQPCHPRVGVTAMYQGGLLIMSCLACNRPAAVFAVRRETMTEPEIQAAAKALQTITGATQPEAAA